MYNAQANGAVSVRRGGVPSGIAILALALVVIVGAAYALLNRLDSPADPAPAFAAAFDGMRGLDSVHVVMVGHQTGGVSSHRFTNLGVLDIEITEHYAPADWDAFESQTEEECLVEDGDYRHCIIRKRGTGEKVGEIETGFLAKTTIEGNVALPDKVHYRTTMGTDRPTAISAAGRGGLPTMESVYVDGKSWSKTGGYWHTSAPDGSLLPLESALFRWGLLDVPGRESRSLLERYDSVERLEEAELDGLLVEGYLARSVDGGETVEVWVGKEDGLVRKVDTTLDVGSGKDAFSIEKTYTFSGFNEPVDVPEPWPCFGAAHC